MKHQQPIYADYNATTPIAKGVFEKMLPFLRESYGNPSSTSYKLGKEARTGVENARLEVSKLIGCQPEEVIFTSGGTESIFHAFLGSKQDAYKDCLMISTIEHPAVSEAAAFLSGRFKNKILELGLSHSGDLIYPDSMPENLLLVSIMLANNEIGIILPVEDLTRKINNRCLIHTDAVQAVGKIPINFHSMGVDLMSISAHKFGGPKGVGALIVKKGSNWECVVRGGGQEHGCRGGTEAVSLIVGMGEAARIRRNQMAEGLISRLQGLRDLFESNIQQISGISVNFSNNIRLCNTSSLHIRDIISSELVSILSEYGVMISAGSACKTSTIEPSKVLTKMGKTTYQALETVRVSFGAETTEEEIYQLVESFDLAVKQLRNSAKTKIVNLIKR